MRADRLLSLLMLLQNRGGLTARQLAEELEVSERTIYRDLIALSSAGIPVYTQRGPGGGCYLVEDYRTDLTGLSPNEARALFMLAIPAPLNQLGVGQELKAALGKLAAALPPSRRSDSTLTRQRIHLDPTAWVQSTEPIPHLATLQNALWQDRKLFIRQRSFYDSQVEAVVCPYGLVAKADIWYLVAARRDHMLVTRVSEILAAEALPETFERPADFNLPAFWEAWCATNEAYRPRYSVTARVALELMPFFPRVFGKQASQIKVKEEGRDTQGWTTVVIPFESLPAARALLLGLGGAVEVLEPLALRLSIQDFAMQTLKRYAEQDSA